MPSYVSIVEVEDKFSMWVASGTVVILLTFPFSVSMSGQFLTCGWPPVGTHGCLPIVTSLRSACIVLTTFAWCVSICLFIYLAKVCIICASPSSCHPDPSASQLLHGGSPSVFLFLSLMCTLSVTLFFVVTISWIGLYVFSSSFEIS